MTPNRRLGRCPRRPLAVLSLHETQTPELPPARPPPARARDRRLGSRGRTLGAHGSTRASPRHDEVVDVKLADESLSGSWLSTRLGVGTQRLDAMRRAGELLGVRRPGGHDCLYPGWQFAPDGRPRPVVGAAGAVRPRRGARNERLYEVLSAPHRDLGRRTAPTPSARAGTTCSRSCAPPAGAHGPRQPQRRRKSFGSRTVLDGLDFAIEPGARVGVVGANGSGKSTMLKLIAELEEPDAGTSCAGAASSSPSCPSIPSATSGTPSRPCVPRTPRPGRAGSRPPPGRRPARRTRLAADLDRMTRVLRRQEETVELEAAGGPSIDSRARAMLLDLGIVEDDLTLPTSALSGGQRKLIALAACLAQDPDVLLLDEPEAHLDAVGRSLLERLLATFDGAAVAVSHDRYLLDETVRPDRRGNPPRPDPDVARELLGLYARARNRAAAPGSSSSMTQQKEVERLEASIRRFKDWAHKGRRRAPHQAGAQQAAPDRPDGEGRATRPRAPQDRAAAAPAPAGRSARLRAPARSGSSSATTSSSPAST